MVNKVRPNKAAGAWRPGEVLRGLLLEHWGTKATALAFSLLVFVLTRDEMRRTFQIPLEVREDPDRMLVTALPETIGVEVQGPWAKMNRLTQTQLGRAKLDLQSARPGPLQIDAATIVMPPGVVLSDAGLIYDRVDLRFETILQRDLPIRAEVVGEVDKGYKLVEQKVSPARWTVRGPQNLLSELSFVRTEAVELSGIRGIVRHRVRLEELADGLSYLGAFPGRLPGVDVWVKTKGVRGDTEYMVPLIPAFLRVYSDPMAMGSRTLQPIKVSGSRAALDRLDELSEPILVSAKRVEIGEKKQSAQVEFRFTVNKALAPELRKELRLDPQTLVVALGRN